MRSSAIKYTILSLLCCGVAACSAKTQIETAEGPLPLSSTAQFVDLSPDQKAELATCQVDASQFERLMTLDKQAFDQDFTGGWRAVAYEDGCEMAAGQLIVSYIARHDIQADGTSNVVFWHVGQMLAAADRTDEAIEYFKLSFDPDAEPGSHEADWATYAEGTIAYLKKDKPGLEAAMARLDNTDGLERRKAQVAAMKISNPEVSFPDGYPEKPLNLIALEGLMRCFDKPYSEAYDGCKASD